MKHRIARGLALALWLAALVGAAPSSILPDTPLGRRAAGYLEAFNSGREEVVRDFLEANVPAAALKERPIERRLEVYRGMREEHGTLTPVRLLDQGDDHVRVVARTRSDRVLDLTFLFEAAPPHGFLGLRIIDDPGAGAGAGADAEETVAPLSDEQAVGAWRAHLDSLSRAGRFSGAVLLARDGVPLFKAAYGDASRARHVANRADTRFNLGSINKIFTKLAIGQLVEQGKVRLDDTIDRYLPDYPRDVASRVTVRHLLAHRGGIGDIFGPAYDRMDHSRLRSVADWIPLFRDKPLAFEPGSGEAYSNGGYVLLGAIVERASGEDYYDYVRHHIYEPLGMKDTDHYLSDGRTQNLAAGYTRERLPGVKPDASGWGDNGPTRPFRGSPAGGGYSTLDDLLRFTQAMRAGKLLKPETIRSDFREFQTNDKGELGLGIGGGAPGINAGVETLGPYTLIVLANLDPPAAQAATRWLSRRLSYDGPRIERRMIGPGSGGGAHGGASGAEGDTGGSEGARVEGGAEGGGPGIAIRGPRRDAPERSSIPAGGVEVEMLRADHLPAVRVKVNGQGPFLFGIDTGGQGSARLDSAVAAKLGLEVIGQARAGDPSGRHSRLMDLVRIESLEIAGARFEGLTAAVRDYNERRMGQPIDGILGFGLFEQALLTLDYPAAKVRIESGELPAADGREVIPFDMERGIPSIELKVGPVTVRADVDAGSMGGFSLPAELIARLPLASAPRVVGRARTVSNEFEIQQAQLNGSVHLGRYDFPDPLIEFQPVFPMANIGARVLRDFSVTFDQKNRRMRLVKPV